MTYIIRLFFVLLAAALLLPGCSAERNNPLSKSYHNVTAHYNGYFLAREKMAEVETKVADAVVNDYNQVLPIYPPLDTTFLGTLRPDLEDIIKKASIPVQRHKNSRWVDDSYVLIGKARFYQSEFEDAIRTFKYVHLTGKDDAAKHEALVWLMRTFIETHEHEEAVQVSDYLNKLPLNKENFRDHLLARAHFLAVTGGAPKRIIDNLDLALPHIDRRDDRSRVNFILAQLHQNLGQDEPAYKHYAAVLRKNPPYELGFYSKLSLGQVSPVGNSGERAKIERYFRKLLKDSKNEDYRDKIYYEMARFELKQQHYDKSLEYLRQSVRESGTNPTQQAYSYLLAGRIYFENLKKYRPAQIYYDSALQVYPQDAADYASLAERRDILTEFATHITTVETEDSLQVLAKLDTASLNKRIEEIIAMEEKRQLEAQKALEARQALAARKSRRSGNAGAGMLTASLDNNSGAGWYFDNPTLVASSRSEFVRKWGDRALQDNWRRVNQRVADLPQAGNGTATASAATEVAAPPDPEEVKRAQRQQYLADIPTTPKQLAESDLKIENALYNLGNIYQHKLKEPEQAIESYEQLLTRFPQHPNKAEVYYSLFLLHGQNNTGKEGQYADLLKKEFPTSRFAHLVDNPLYEEMSTADRQLLNQLYDSAYTYYSTEKFKEAIDLNTQIKQRFPQSEISDKVAFLDVLLVGRTQPAPAFQAALIQFTEDYPSSPLKEKAEDQLQTFEDFQQGMLNQPLPPSPIRTALLKLEEEMRVTASAAEAQQASEAQAFVSARDRARGKKPVKKAAPKAAIKAVASPTDTASVQQVDDPDSDPALASDSLESLQADAPVVEVDTLQTDVPATDTLQAKTPADSPAAGTPEAAAPEAGAPDAVAPAEVAPEPVASPYQAGQQGQHLFVVAYPPGDSAFAKIKDQFAVHNDRYHKSKRLQIEEASLGDNQALLVTRGFADGKTANSYASMQKTKSSPLSKVNGAEFTTFVISAENLPVLLERQNVEEYLNFFQANYLK